MHAAWFIPSLFTGAGFHVVLLFHVTVCLGDSSCESVFPSSFYLWSLCTLHSPRVLDVFFC